MKNNYQIQLDLKCCDNCKNAITFDDSEILHCASMRYEIVSPTGICDKFSTNWINN
jgi:hypothetical protein